MSGQLQAELNQCQAQGLQQHLSIPNFPSWQQQVSGVVYLGFFFVQTQLWGQDRTTWEEPPAGHRGALGTGRGACEVPDSAGLGDWEQLCLDFIKGAVHTWQSSCCRPGWGPRASQPTVNPSNQRIASTPWHKPSSFCTRVHSYCKAEGVIWNHNIHLTSERGCFTQNHNSFGQVHIFVSWINLCSFVVPFTSDCQKNSGGRLDIIASKGFLPILLKKNRGKNP